MSLLEDDDDTCSLNAVVDCMDAAMDAIGLVFSSKIVVCHIMPYCSLRDVKNMRHVCRRLKSPLLQYMIENYVVNLLMLSVNDFEEDSNDNKPKAIRLDMFRQVKHITELRTSSG